MPDIKYDPAAHAANAARLSQLATEARTELRRQIVDRTAKIETERDEVARRAYGAEHEAAAAEQQVKRALSVAESYDKQATDLEQQARTAPTDDLRDEFREKAAIIRANADAERQRGHVADERAAELRAEKAAADALVTEFDGRVGVEQSRSLRLDAEIDQLERFAADAGKRSAWADEAAKLDARADAAEQRGETSLATRLRADATMRRDYIDSSAEGTDIEPNRVPDAAALRELGITVPDDALAIPGLGAPVLPTPPSSVPAPATDEPAATTEPRAEPDDDLVGSIDARSATDRNDDLVDPGEGGTTTAGESAYGWSEAEPVDAEPVDAAPSTTPSELEYQAQPEYQTEPSYGFEEVAAPEFEPAYDPQPVDEPAASVTWDEPVIESESGWPDDSLDYS